MTENIFFVQTDDINSRSVPLTMFTAFIGATTPLYCKEIVKSPKGVRQTIVLEDVQKGMLIRIGYNTYKDMLLQGQTVCINYGISKDGKLIKKANSPMEQAYIQIIEYNHKQEVKCRLLGITFHPDVYKIEADGGVLLVQAYNIVNNVYYMPPFVTGLDISEKAETITGVFKGHTGSLKVVNPNNRIKVMDYMFAKNLRITELDLTEFSTAGCTSMKGMFFQLGGYYAKKVEIKGVENFDTSEVTDMQGMFTAVTGLSALNLNSWNTSKVVNMSSMFFGCSGLITLFIRDWNTSSCLNFSCLFSGCVKLVHLDISMWNTSKGKSFRNCFYNCVKLSVLNVESWDMRSMQTCEHMFAYCRSLSKIVLNKWRSPDLVNTANMFIDCESLCYADLTGWLVQKLTKCDAMFSGCARLKSVSLEGWKTERLTSTSFMFCNCTALETLRVEHLNVSKVKNMTYMFKACTQLKHLMLKAWDLHSLVKSAGMFMSCQKLVTIQRPVTDFLCKESKTIEKIFSSCENLRELRIFLYERQEETKYSALGIPYKSNEYEVMLNGDVILKQLYGVNGIYYIPKFVTVCYQMNVCLKEYPSKIKVIKRGKLTNLRGFFADLKGVTEIDLTEFQLFGEDITSMFAGCSQLQTVYFGEWNLTGITSLSNLFLSCSSLESLDLSGWVTNKIENMHSLFDMCEHLKTLNLSGWSFKSVRRMDDIFCGCAALQDIIGFDFSGWYKKDFRDCNKRLLQKCSE